jgi:hypothetical protein
MVKRIFMVAALVAFSAYANAAVELDADSNGATDISKGGTNASSAANARTNLGLGTSDNPSFNSLNASGGNLAAANKQVTKAWQTGLSYTADVTSVIHGGQHYIAKTTHTAGSTSEPGVGASWETDWAVDSGGGGYTNLTSFVNQTNWRVFYSDGSGDVKELALGPDGEYLKSNGASAAPSWATPTGAAHDAVTLDTETAAIFSLSTQQLTLDSQTANHVFAAPNGSSGDPTFRALVDGDIPSAIARDSELPTDATISTTDVTTNNAGTTKHGWLLKATAPASGLRNIVAIDNAETVYKNAALFDATSPSTQAFGDAAAVGSAMTAARLDHKHAMPAAPTTITGNAGGLSAQYIDWSASSGGASIANKPTLGTVAQYNVGTGANNIVQLNGSGQLPFTISLFDLTANSVSLDPPTTTGSWMTFASTTGAASYLTPGTGVATALGNATGGTGGLVTFSGALGTPSFTALNLPSSDADPSTTAGQLRHDTTITGLTAGALKYWNGTNARILVDLDTAPVTDDYVVAYDADADKFYMKADSTGAGGTLTSGDIDTSSELYGIVTDETGSASGTPKLVFNQAPRIDNIELGADIDTTLSRNAAGVLQVEGVVIPSISSTNTLSNKSIIAVEVDGSAAGTLTAAQVSGTIVTNRGQGAADVALTLPTAAAGYNALFTVGTAQSNKWGVRAATNDKIYLLAADGTISAGSDNGYARMTAAQVGQAFACWTFQTGSSAWDWQCKASAIGTSTFAAN